MDVVGDSAVVVAEVPSADDVRRHGPYCVAVDAALVVGAVVVAAVGLVQRDKRSLVADSLSFDAEPLRPFEPLAEHWVVVDLVGRNIQRRLLPAYLVAVAFVVVHLVEREDLVVVVVQTMLAVVRIALQLLGMQLAVASAQMLLHFASDVHRAAEVVVHRH